MFSPELVAERIKASVEPQHAQIFAFTELLDRSIQGKSPEKTATVSSRGTRHRCESPNSKIVSGSPRFSTLAPYTTAGYSLDNEL